MIKQIYKIKINFVLVFLVPTIFLAQDFKLIQNDDEALLVGIVTRTEFQDSNFSSWFNREYTNYRIDGKALSEIKNSFEDKIIKIVLGTWCSDSKREVPRFVKVLDFMEFPFDKTQFICVDREKKGLNNEDNGLDVLFVPTFIVYENGSEIGRIVENPIESLEKDLAGIVD